MKIAAGSESSDHTEIEFLVGIRDAQRRIDHRRRLEILVRDLEVCVAAGLVHIAVLAHRTMVIFDDVAIDQDALRDLVLERHEGKPSTPMPPLVPHHDSVRNGTELLEVLQET